MRLIGDAERRARLARRHALAPQHRVADAVAATAAMTVLHATEPATPYLSLLARTGSFTGADMDDALFESRSLVKQLAMRRTLFVFPRQLLPAGPWAALLPALDPTALGWKERDFYLAPDFYSAIFDWSGNCGTTAWWDGQIVGAYVQDDAGRVELIVPRDPGPAGRAALQAEAKRLEDWLDGEKVSPAYKPPLVTGDRTGPVSERLRPGPP